MYVSQYYSLSNVSQRPVLECLLSNREFRPRNVLVGQGIENGLNSMKTYKLINSLKQDFCPPNRWWNERLGRVFQHNEHQP